MGCLSFKCKISKKVVNSDSSTGDAVHLFLLKEGQVIEHMFGNYDSYGRVFADKRESHEWTMDWSDVCNLMFSSNKGNGIAAILASEWKEGDPFPKTRSADDPNQGWGKVRNGNKVIGHFHKMYPVK